ncbi:MAG TPA: hypothetical protein PLL54_03100 [Dermatophilaceae bacterium]|nr:hypothetical protein [Dermatophilaceae bacterium]
MSVKNTLAVGFAVIGIAVSAAQALEPKSPAEQQRQVQEQRYQVAADADGRSKETMREQGNAAAEANQRDKLNPTEPRPPVDTKTNPKTKVPVKTPVKVRLK